MFSTSPVLPPSGNPLLVISRGLDFFPGERRHFSLAASLFEVHGRPVLAYVLVITLMLSGAWAVFQDSTFSAGGRAFLFAGALCFYLSDILVARDRFIRAEFSNRLLGLPLYYAGQFLLAFPPGF